jgi:hypothetical protein
MGSHQALGRLYPKGAGFRKRREAVCDRVGSRFPAGSGWKIATVFTRIPQLRTNLRVMTLALFSRALTRNGSKMGV